MYYIKLLAYYALTVIRNVLLLLFIPVKWLGVTVVDTVSAWELTKPVQLTEVDNSDLEDYLHAEDPYYTKHHVSVKRYGKKQHIKE